MSAKQLEKPPIGLTPKWLRDEQRAAEILAAMGRYVEAGKRIPHAWLKELAEVYGEN